MARTFLLFTTPTCPNCPAAKELLQKSSLEGEIMDASTAEGLDKARKHGITQVPSAIFFEEGKQVAKAHGVDAIEAELKK